MDNKENALENYLEFLKLGATKTPIESLKVAGVDMTKEDALNDAFVYFEELVKELESLYKNQEVPKLKFMNVQKQDLELILMPNEKKDNEQILYLKPGSIILPLKMIKEDTNTILYQYKVLKAISDEIENKKAV